MMNRRSNIHKLYTELAARIVNFDSVQEIDKQERVFGFGVSALPKLRQKYVEYAQQMVEMESLGIMVNKGDQLQKLLLCIQRERLWLKQNSRNLDPVFFWAGGDGPSIITEKPTEAYQSRKEWKVFKVTEGIIGGKSILPTKDRTNNEAVLGDRNNSRNHGKVNNNKREQSVDDDEDECIVLYGLICA